MLDGSYSLTCCVLSQVYLTYTSKHSWFHSHVKVEFQMSYKHSKDCQYTLPVTAKISLRNFMITKVGVVQLVARISDHVLYCSKDAHSGFFSASSGRRSSQQMFSKIDQCLEKLYSQNFTPVQSTSAMTGLCAGS